MEIRTKKQYNHSIGKFKLLSSNAGVGSVIATRWGVFIMPLSSSKWDFVAKASEYSVANPELSDDRLAVQVKNNLGVEFIRDERFIDYLKNKKEMPQLTHFVAIPQLQLSALNYCMVKAHPLYKNHQAIVGGDLKEERFSIPAINFPKWFYSRAKKTLMHIDKWQSLWRANNCNNGLSEFFAPPRDYLSKTDYEHPEKTCTKFRLTDKAVYECLKQVPLLLICPNGHITDVPWKKYFAAKLDNVRMGETAGIDLFDYQSDSLNCAHGGEHELQWIENRNNAESWGLLKCSKCGKIASLEGVMNIRPFCNCDKPWENSRDHYCRDANGANNTMRCVLATSNSVYYAQTESSLYIPQELLPSGSLTHNAHVVLERLEALWTNEHQKNSTLTKESYAQAPDFMGKLDFIAMVAQINPLSDEEKIMVQNTFVGIARDDADDVYRFQEYSAFMKEGEYHFNNEKYLSYRTVEVPESLRNYIVTIKQVDSLAETMTQLGFSRVSMPEMIVDENGHLTMPNRVQNIFAEAKTEVRCLPAVQSFGEGIFIAFNLDYIDQWYNRFSGQLTSRYTQDVDSLYRAMYDRLNRYSLPKFYLLHTFSHLILKELEFSCGYPTASLKERLYFSDRMNGVLIYTADGSEGSMGGLVNQGRSDIIERIIKRALKRALNCSSDPLCWENEDQLNFASCFACSMVSETACEERNLGLDRRILVDEEFGFFRELINN